MPNRYCCDVIDEMRTAIKVGRIDMVLGLAEELQTLVNRMESKLHDYATMGYHLESGREFKKELQKLQKEAEEIEKKLETN